MKTAILFFLLLLFSVDIISQTMIENRFGTVYRYQSDFTSFPHEERANGYIYQENHYSADIHYRDSTVLLFIPKYLKVNNDIDFIFYFHGWRNNIDSTISRFNLIKQFYESGKNGILILPETAKNSPDSFGGKLEEKNIFQKLVNEISGVLQRELEIKHNPPTHKQEKIKELIDFS